MGKPPSKRSRSSPNSSSSLSSTTGPLIPPIQVLCSNINCQREYSLQAWACPSCHVWNHMLTQDGLPAGPPSPIASTATADSAASSASSSSATNKGGQKRKATAAATTTPLPMHKVNANNVRHYFPEHILASGGEFTSCTLPELNQASGENVVQLTRGRIFGLGFKRIVPEGKRGKPHPVVLTVSSGVEDSQIDLAQTLNFVGKFRDSATAIAGKTKNTKSHERKYEKSRVDYLRITHPTNRMAIVFCAVNALPPDQQPEHAPDDDERHLPELQPVFLEDGTTVIRLCYGKTNMRITYVGVYSENPSLYANFSVRGVCAQHDSADVCRQHPEQCKSDVDTYLASNAQVYDPEGHSIGQAKKFLSLEDSNTTNHQPQPPISVGYIECTKCGGSHHGSFKCPKCPPPPPPPEAALEAKDEGNASIGSLTPHSADSSSSYRSTPTSFASSTPSSFDSPYSSSSMSTQTTELSDGTSSLEVSEANSHFWLSDQTTGQPNEYTQPFPSIQEVDDLVIQELLQERYEEQHRLQQQAQQQDQLQQAHMEEEDEGEVVPLPDLWMDQPQFEQHHPLLPMVDDGPQPMDWYLIDDQPGPIPQPNGC